MQKFLLLYTLLSLIIGTRIDFDSADCQVFQNKLANFSENSDGSIAVTSKIAFQGKTSFIGTTADVEVQLRYSDNDYFNDPKFKGLVVQDGKTPETTCLDMKLLKFTASDFLGGIEVTDLIITPSENLTKRQRFYSFTIKGSELATRMTETKNTDYFIYQGYYAIAFYAAETDNLLYPFYFGFTVTVNRATGAAVDSTFRLFDHLNYPQFTQIYGGGCSKPATSIQWCTDFTCTEFATPDLHLNDQFVLLQKVTTSEMANYYLTEIEVRYTGYGLNKKATIQQFDNKTPGQVKLLLNAEIVWRAVSIEITSFLSTNSNGIRTLIEQTIFDSVSGYTAEIVCIKAEGFDICSTCEQECDANGFASDGCDSCSIAYILYVSLLVFLVIAF